MPTLALLTFPEATVSHSRKNARPVPRMAMEVLEDRTVPAMVYVDDSLVAGTAIENLPASVALTFDRDSSGTLTAGDRVTIGVGEAGTTANLTFDAAPGGGDVGSAYSTIQSAISAADPGDIVKIAAGTYAESVLVNRPLTLDGLTGTAADVVIDPTTGPAIEVAANAVVLQDLRVTGGTEGISSNVAITGLTLSNVQIDGNTAGGTITLSPGAAVYFTAENEDVPYAITANATSLQFTRGSGASAIASQTLNLAGAPDITLNLTGGSAGDTFHITPAPPGGATIDVDGGPPVPADVGTSGDVLDVDLSGVTATFNSTFSQGSGFSGTVSFADGQKDIVFSGIESFADGGTISGVVFSDTNNNGTKQPSEPGLAGVSVQLDFDADGTVDLTVPSGSDGLIQFAGLPPGTYRVRIITPDGATLTTPLPPDITTTLGSTDQVQFGVHFNDGGTAGLSTVTGIVFNDANNDGIRNAGEIGVNRLLVYLDLNGNGRLDRKSEPSTRSSTVDGIAGSYTLTSDVVGTSAVVRVVEVPGYLRNTTNSVVSLTAGQTEIVDVGVRANLPPQATPAKLFAAGIVEGNAAQVRVFDSAGNPQFEIPVGNNLPGGVRVAVGDVTGDGVDDVVIGTGPGVPALVTVVDGATQKEIFQTSPFEESFAGGVFVAIGDVTGDGIGDIIVTPDVSGGPRVVVIRGGDFATVASFLGITDDPNFRGGARANVGDINGDGRPDIIVAAGFSGGPRVAVFDGLSIVTGQFRKLMNDFLVFEDSLRNGVYVASGDVNGDGIDDVILGAGPGGGPRVLILDGQTLKTGGIQAALGDPLANFFAGNSDNRGGVHVAARDLDDDGRADLVTGGGTGHQISGIELDDLSELFSIGVGSDSPGGVYVG